MGLGRSKCSTVNKQNRILLLGLDSSGKSTLLYKLKLATDVVTTPTIGFNVEMIEMEKKISLTIWDVGGQKGMRTYWRYYCENIDGLVYVVDSSDKRSLEDSKREFQNVLKYENIKNVPVVLLANKQDLPGALSAEEIIKKFNMEKYCGDRKWYVQPCCALSGDGLVEGFRKITGFVKSHREETLAKLRL
ncbi:ADP-ribosylation factor-like protein 14 [Tachyglossus aculeatus]|uniref:ADP-ribosylation factor-like protein 14 n=1 Tax=Tachyglossus aculeatus TaxID=9261 RepID=UPI0018F57B17|nr:ADP-ribosylation factor-like protein 14 [Tachyglossus aculeatus]